MKKVLYTCPFVPAEWIEAHGLVARRITPHAGVQHGRLFPEPGVCPFAASFAEHVAEAGDHVAAIFTSKCDQMRRLFDLVIARCSTPCFLLNVPTVVDSSSAEQMYVSELHRLGRFLEQIGGAAPTSDWSHGRTVPQDGPCVPENETLVRLAVTGGPLSRDSGFFEQVQQDGGVVVVDASENSDQMRCVAVNPDQYQQDPLRELARVYLSTASVHQRPNVTFYDRLRDRVVGQSVSGVILRRYVWCDLWHAEAHRLTQVLGVPVLDLEVESDRPADIARSSNRIGAFIEMLQSAASNLA